MKNPKTMKRLLAAVLMLCLAFGASYACASTIEKDGAQTATTSVVLDLGEQPTSYTITIPSQVTINPETGIGEGTITLKSGFVLTDVTSLYVRMTDGFKPADSTAPARMTLQNTQNGSTLPCLISRNSVSDSVQYIIDKTTNLINVTNQSDNSHDYSETLTFDISGDLPSYGKYTGTLTFSVVTQ